MSASDLSLDGPIDPKMPSTYTELDIVQPSGALIGVDNRQIHGPGRDIVRACINALSSHVSVPQQEAALVDIHE